MAIINATHPASKYWTFYSVQKKLPFAGSFGFAHNFARLVDPSGTVQCEIQGVYSDHFTSIVYGGPPVDGNYLYIIITAYNGYMSGQQDTVAYPVISYQTKSQIISSLKFAYQTVKTQLDSKKMLYYGYGASLPFTPHAVNSNSVWNTFLRILGVNPAPYKGPLIPPGWMVDLRQWPSNNPLDGEGKTDKLWTPGPQIETMSVYAGSPQSSNLQRQNWAKWLAAP